MAAILSSSLGAGIKQAAGSSENAEVNSRTLARSRVGAKGAPIKSTSYFQIES